MKKYVVKDYYDNWFTGDVVGIREKLTEAKGLAFHYDEDECDGECSLSIEEYEQDENGKWVFTGNTFTY